MTPSIILATIIVSLTLALEHYFPWSRLLAGRQLPPPWSYVAGVAALGAVFTGWLLLDAPADPFQIVLGFWAIVVAGGASVLACYLLDFWLATRATNATRDILNNHGQTPSPPSWVADVMPGHTGQPEGS